MESEKPRYTDFITGPNTLYFFCRRKEKTLFYLKGSNISNNLGFDVYVIGESNPSLRLTLIHPILARRNNIC